MRRPTATSVLATLGAALLAGTTLAKTPAAPPAERGCALHSRPENPDAVKLAPVTSPSPPADRLPLAKVKVPDGFKVEVLASGMPNAHSMAIGSEGTVFVGSRRQNHRHRPPPRQRRRLQGRQPLRRRTLEDLARRQYIGQSRHLTPSRTSPKISSTVSPPGPRRPPTSGSLTATRATSPTLNMAGATPAAKPPYPPSSWAPTPPPVACASSWAACSPRPTRTPSLSPSTGPETVPSRTVATSSSSSSRTISPSPPPRSS